jgi:DNA (cytosine-5)-methyltransferase 1
LPAKCGHRQRRFSFSFIDLFAGIGGMRVPFEELGGTCVFSSEWDEKAQETYKANFGERPHGDIRGIPAESIPDHDILLAGFPCQPFSIAGVSKKNALGQPHGFACETQGTLFFDILSILREKRPIAFLLENVKHLLAYDKGKTFATIRDALQHAELGYRIYTRIIDAQAFVPQHRERLFIVGFREPVKFDFERLRLPPRQKWPRLATVLHPEDGSEPVEPRYTSPPKGVVNEKYGLTPHLWRYLQDYAAKHKAMGNGFGFGLVGPHDVARTLSARYYKDGSEILVRRGRALPPRRLTPRECARLMGFDRPKRKFIIPESVSDTQAYKQFGNAVAPPVVAVVAHMMLPHLRQIKAQDLLR